MEIVIRYFSENYMTLAILVILSVTMLLNRKISIPASQLFPAAMIVLVAMSVASFANDLISEMTFTDTGEMHLFTEIRLILSIFCYIARPLIILIELLIIIPHLKYKVLASVPWIVNCAVYISAPFTGSLILTYNNNTFYRGNLGYTTYFVIIFYVGLLLYCSLKRFDRKNTGKIVMIIAITVISLFTALMEFENMEPSYVDPVMALSMLSYYVYLVTICQQEMKESIIEKELRIEQDNLKLMRRQIQPHFIYNTLGVIRSLARQDGALAVECIDSFSDYLKAHIRAIQSNDPIPFEKEIENVEAYLSLVQADHFMNINIIYDFKEQDFSIPPLTIEPIVENAVKYGVSPDGSTIIISTFTRGDNIVISVTDDGTRPAAITDEEQETLGIGLENTRMRVRLQCGGDCETKSGSKGTTVEITIPDKRRCAE